MSKPFPIVEYAHKIKKNTADFTVNDLVAFMKWWVKQPVRKDILAMKSKYDKLASKKVDQESIDDGEAEEAQEESTETSSEVIAELGLTKLDVDALLWALNEIFTGYELKGTTYEKPLTELNETLSQLTEE